MEKFRREGQENSQVTFAAFALIIVIGLLATGFSGAIVEATSTGNSAHSNYYVPSQVVRGPFSSPSPSPVGLSISGTNATYYSSFPVGGPYASFQSSIGTDSSGFGSVVTSSLTDGIKFYVYVSEMSPPVLFSNHSGGLRPNYSLQSNFFVNGSGSGGEGLYWTQLGMEFMFVKMSTNQSVFEIAPFFEYWWPGLSNTGDTYFNWSSERTVESGPGHPFLVEGWEFTGLNNSGEFVNSTIMIRGYVNGNGTGSSSYRYGAFWYNTTYFLGVGGDRLPPFTLLPVSAEGNQGVGIVGAGSHQVVWGNYTAYELVEELVNGSFVLPQVSSVVDGISGESSAGLHGGIVVNQSSNPFGLPAFTPFAYLSNYTSVSDNAAGVAYFPIVVQGYVFPFNATISAYAVRDHMYLSIERSGASFLVETVGSQITSIVINISASGYVNYSVEYFPSSTNISRGVELHTPFVSLQPLSGNVVYGFMELPFPYLAYLMDNYIYSNGGSRANMTFWDTMAHSWRDWFTVAVSSGGVKIDLSWYVPTLLQDYASVIFNFTKWGSNWTFQPYYSYITHHYLDSPVYLPYSFTVNNSASISIESPLLNQSFSMPALNAEYNVTPSMFIFQIPVIVDSTALWYQNPYAIGQVEWNGQSVWVGDSLNASFTFPYSVNSSSDIFNILNYSVLHSHSLNVSDMEFSAFVSVYSYSGLERESFNVTIPLFNYSVAALVSVAGAEHFPVHLHARLGGSLNLTYPVAIMALVIVLTLGIILKRRNRRDVKK